MLGRYDDPYVHWSSSSTQEGVVAKMGFSILVAAPVVLLLVESRGILVAGIRLVLVEGDYLPNTT